MCQGEILKVLEKTDKWLSRSDFEEAIGVTGSVICTSLSKLRKYDEVEYKLIEGKNQHYIYHHKSEKVKKK